MCCSCDYEGREHGNNFPINKLLGQKAQKEPETKTKNKLQKKVKTTK